MKGYFTKTLNGDEFEIVSEPIHLVDIHNVVVAAKNLATNVVCLLNVEGLKIEKKKEYL